MALDAMRYEKYRDRGSSGSGGGGGGGGGSVASASTLWTARDREREREQRERQARVNQQMSHPHAPESDASSLFAAPVKVTGIQDQTSQTVQKKLGNYQFAQSLIDDPSKSIGICAEPQSPAPHCLPSRRENEFKKPSHAPQNGRVHYRPYSFNKGESSGPSSASAVTHRPPPHRASNGVQAQSAPDSEQFSIDSILKEMKTIPSPLTAIPSSPMKPEPENKFSTYKSYQANESKPTTNGDVKPPNPNPGKYSYLSI